MVIVLDYDGAMWGGHFPFRDDELENCVRSLSASGKTGEISVALRDPDKRPASDLYTQLLVLRDEVQRALPPGGSMRIFVEMNIPWPPVMSCADVTGERAAPEPR
jgi:hypothetical protein